MNKTKAQNETSGEFQENYINLESRREVAYEDIKIQEADSEGRDKRQLKVLSGIRRRINVGAFVILILVITQIASIVIFGLHLSKILNHQSEPRSQESNGVEELRQETVRLIAIQANTTLQEISGIKDSVAQVRSELSNLTDSLGQENALNQCPSNWVVREKSCYHFSHDQQTWAAAVAICSLFKSHLVVVNDASENSFITSNTGGRRLWIGLNDLIEEGTWKWLNSNARPSYFNWESGEPNNADNLENCVLVENSLGEWNDIQCKSLEYYICEIELE